MSKTISITIPDQLETALKRAADDLDISRSRYIGNLLLNWNEKRLQIELETNLKNSPYGDKL